MIRAVPLLAVKNQNLQFYSYFFCNKACIFKNVDLKEYSKIDKN